MGFFQAGFGLNRPKLSPLKSRAVIPLFVLLLLSGSSTSASHSHCSQGFPPTFTSPTSSSLFVSMRSSTARPHFCSSTTCIRELAWMHSRILLNCLCSPVLSLSQILMWLKPCHEDKGLWMWGFFQLPEEGLFFLIRWSVADVYHNIFHTGGPVNPDP